MSKFIRVALKAPDKCSYLGKNKSSESDNNLHFRQITLIIEKVVFSESCIYSSLWSSTPKWWAFSRKFNHWNIFFVFVSFSISYTSNIMRNRNISDRDGLNNVFVCKYYLLHIFKLLYSSTFHSTINLFLNIYTMNDYYYFIVKTMLNINCIQPQLATLNILLS